MYSKLEYEFYPKYFLLVCAVHLLHINADRHVLLHVLLPRRHLCEALLIS